MRKMIWTPECKTGFDEIDSQHRLLFAISNELLDIEYPAKQQDEIKYLLNHLMDYINNHFKTEEKYFEKHSYPGLKEHREKHTDITEEIKKVVKNAQSLFELKENLDTMLDNWVKVHILLEDKKFSKWAQSKGIISSVI